MITVIDVPAPKRTRLIVGCHDQALIVNDALIQCGIKTKLSQSKKIPHRDLDERIRAEQLMRLLYAQAEECGTA